MAGSGLIYGNLAYIVKSELWGPKFLDSTQPLKSLDSLKEYDRNLMISGLGAGIPVSEILLDC